MTIWKALATLVVSVALTPLLLACQGEPGPHIDNSTGDAFLESFMEVHDATEREDDQKLIHRIYMDLFASEDARHARYRVDGMNSRQLLEWSTTDWARDGLQHAESRRASRQRLREQHERQRKAQEEMNEFFEGLGVR